MLYLLWSYNLDSCVFAEVLRKLGQRKFAHRPPLAQHVSFTLAQHTLTQYVVFTLAQHVGFTLAQHTLAQHVVFTLALHIVFTLAKHTLVQHVVFTLALHVGLTLSQHTLAQHVVFTLVQHVVFTLVQHVVFTFVGKQTYVGPTYSALFAQRCYAIWVTAVNIVIHWENSLNLFKFMKAKDTRLTLHKLWVGMQVCYPGYGMG